MDTATLLPLLAKASYFLAAVLFILGIKRMSSPVTARKGIVQAGIGMVLATVATFGVTGSHNLVWILGGLALGIVLVGAMVALANAESPLAKAIGFIGVILGAGNAAGGYVVTERMLEMFKSSKVEKK